MQKWPVITCHRALFAALIVVESRSILYSAKIKWFTEYNRIMAEHWRINGDEHFICQSSFLTANCIPSNGVTLTLYSLSTVGVDNRSFQSCVKKTVHSLSRIGVDNWSFQSYHKKNTLLPFYQLKLATEAAGATLFLPCPLTIYEWKREPYD